MGEIDTAKHEEEHEEYSNSRSRTCSCCGCCGSDGKDNDCNRQSITVLLSTLVCNVFVAGNIVSFAAYYVILTQYFSVSKATAGWVGSIQTATKQAGGKYCLALRRQKSQN